MATKTFWIQIENKPWDMNPHNINRMTGEVIAAADKVSRTLISPPTNATQVQRTVEMAEPVEGEALILRRYAPPQQADKSDAWTVPDDRRVNPWDLNEPDPTDTGTMGTIPGPTIECNVGDDVIVYFRNMDSRLGKPLEERAHSLHPHGIVFAPEHDGAYPLSPMDFDQPVGSEDPLWTALGVTEGFKKGDRVPAGGTFIYKWDTFGWPSTAGVWLYHDHSICDHHNVRLGAIGILVIHNEADENDVLVQDLPGGQPNGRLTKWRYLPVIPKELRLSPVHLQQVPSPMMDEIRADLLIQKTKKKAELRHPHIDRLFLFEGNPIEFARQSRTITAFFRRCYIAPPKQALYLQLYHEMDTVHRGNTMAINGRTWLGNTPTLIGGLETKMRFGLVAMNDATFHTFHLHAHRWVIPGPSGNKVGGGPGGVQDSTLDQAVSQFEDTKIFGPANSFSFTINQGHKSFMGPPLGGGALGEWHMHCHVLNHMMGGMMGSLLIVEDGQVVKPLPRGVKCPEGEVVPGTEVIEVRDSTFHPDALQIPPGTTVIWKWVGAVGHSTTSDTAIWDSSVKSTGVFSRTFITSGVFPYYCTAHGAPGGNGMSGTITVL